MGTDYGYEIGIQNGMNKAKALVQAARENGLCFEAHLPPNLAGWLLEKISRGSFSTPSEAIFFILSEYKDLEQYRDLREEARRRAVMEKSPLKVSEYPSASFKDTLDPVTWDTYNKEEQPLEPY